MEPIQVDARGLSCPGPVLQAKAAIDDSSPEQIKVLVDNEASQQNVQRFLESQGYATSLERQNSDYIISGFAGEKSADPKPAEKESPAAGSKKTLILCSTDRMGYGDSELGLKLMINYIKTLKEVSDELWMLILVNNGVKLAVKGSQVLEDLIEYQNNGLKILVCGTCLDHFNLLSEKQVGETTNMLDVVTSMQLADKVISI